MAKTAGRTRDEVARITVDIWQKLWAHPDAPHIKPEGGLDKLSTDYLGRTRGEVAKRILLMRALKLMDLTMEYAWQQAHPTYHLLVDKETGERELVRYFAEGGTLWGKKGTKKLRARNIASFGEPVEEPEGLAVRTDEKDRPVEAIAGPDAPSPFDTPEMRALRKDEPRAFIEAARQYAHRTDYVIERLNEIEKLGVEIDRDKVMRGIKLQRNDELEGVVNILPYIDELEHRANQTNEWKQDLIATRDEVKRLRADNGNLTGELNRQREANKRLAERLAQRSVAEVNSGTRPTQVLVGSRTT